MSRVAGKTAARRVRVEKQVRVQVRWDGQVEDRAPAVAAVPALGDLIQALADVRAAGCPADAEPVVEQHRFGGAFDCISLLFKWDDLVDV